MERNEIDRKKKTLTEEKKVLPSLGNQNWKKIKSETEKVYKLPRYIPPDDVTKLNRFVLCGSEGREWQTSLLDKEKNWKKKRLKELIKKSTEMQKYLWKEN